MVVVPFELLSKRWVKVYESVILSQLSRPTVTVTVGLLRWLKMTLSYTYTHRFDSNSNGTTAQGSDNFNEGYTENRARIAFDFIF